MKKLPMTIGDSRRRAAVDTVLSILESKGFDVCSIAPGATVYDAIAEMARMEIGALMVVAGGRLIGIISERDYARKVILRGRSSKDTLVNEVMTPSPVTVTPEHTVDECLRIMTEKRIRHLPVVDREEVKGMMSMGDLVKAMLATQAYTIDQLHTYIGAGG
jgi:CBS domain-containing protein